MANILGEGENSCVSEVETPSGTIGNLNIDQDIVNLSSWGNSALTNPGIEFFSVKVPRITKFWAEGHIESDGPFAPEKNPLSRPARPFG